MDKIRVTVWNEFRHERDEERIKNIYPKGIHGCIADFLSECDDLEIRTATLDEPDHGIPNEVLDNTDVLMWWGHMAHGEVSDDRVQYIRERVYNGGMGVVVCHSGHHSKVFKTLVGATGNLCWGDNCQEIVWNLKPSHPIAAGIPEHFILDVEEMYGEPFYIPDPDDLVFGSWFESGHIFRSGCTYTRGVGRIFYFQPGHEECKSFYNPYVQQILKNGVHWVAPTKLGDQKPSECPYVHPVFIKNN